MELNDKKRILVIGCSGSGKSTFANFLGKKFNLEVIHLDKYFWKPNWTMRTNEEFTEIVSNLIQEENWIMDGNYSKTLSIRALYADIIFFFDLPSYICTYRILKRSLITKLGFEKRVDMAEGCPEKWFDWEFVKFTWNFKKNITPLNYKILKELSFNTDKLIIFRKYSEVKNFIRNLNN